MCSLRALHDIFVSTTMCVPPQSECAMQTYSSMACGRMKLCGCMLPLHLKLSLFTCAQNNEELMRKTSERLAKCVCILHTGRFLCGCVDFCMDAWALLQGVLRCM